jgi:ammonia channel protein AmtB
MSEDVQFSWRAVVTASVGIVAGAIALVSLLTRQCFMRPNDVILVFNGHLVGGTVDKLVATSVAVFFGAVAVFALLTYPRRR